MKARHMQKGVLYIQQGDPTVFELRFFSEKHAVVCESGEYDMQSQWCIPLDSDIHMIDRLAYEAKMLLPKATPPPVKTVWSTLMEPDDD
jgi:hypothetical protein